MVTNKKANIQNVSSHGDTNKNLINRLLLDRSPDIKLQRDCTLYTFFIFVASTRPNAVLRRHGELGRIFFSFNMFKPGGFLRFVLSAQEKKEKGENNFLA